MTQQYPALHAATHLPEGSDPLELGSIDKEEVTPVLFCSAVSPVDPTNYDALAWTAASGSAPFSAWILIQAGASYTAGTGNYQIGIPGFGGSSMTFDRTVPIGYGYCKQQSSGQIRQCYLLPAAAPGDYHEPAIYWLDPSTGFLNVMSDSTPFAWVESDTIFAGTMTTI